MNKRMFENESKEIYDNLMKNPNWKAYEIGLKDGRKQGAVDELKWIEVYCKDFSDGKYGFWIDKEEILGVLNKRLKELKERVGEQK